MVATTTQQALQELYEYDLTKLTFEPYHCKKCSGILWKVYDATALECASCGEFD